MPRLPALELEHGWMIADSQILEQHLKDINEELLITKTNLEKVHILKNIDTYKHLCGRVIVTEVLLFFS